MLVDLVGIEPTTSSMPWSQLLRKLLLANYLTTDRVGKSAKNGAFAAKSLSKLLLAKY